MLRGTIDPKEPPTYEYVKFIGNFKSLNNGKKYFTVTWLKLKALSEGLGLGTVCKNLVTILKIFWYLF